MNKLIVVTGGTRGIGLAILRKFAVQGFDVATCSRNQTDLEQLTRDFAQFPVKVFTKLADLSDTKQVKSFTGFILDLNRPIDVLVNNSGTFIPGKITEEEEGSLEHMINTNLYSAYHTTRGVVQRMKDNGGGYIFNLCSIASFMAYPNGGSYAISKFALLGFSKVLRQELKEYGIRVTAIMPGATRTDSWAGTNLPDERFIMPEDVADTIFAAYALSGRSVAEEIIIRPMMGDI